MTVTKTINGTTLIAKVEGRVDTATAPKLEAELSSELQTMEEVRLDFSELKYISSAGLRVLLAAQKKMNAHGGSLILTNVSESVREVFEITGFLDILTIE